MARLSASEYEKRKANAELKMAKNALVLSLTEEQHDALATLCAARHNMHSSMDSCAKSTENGLLQDIIRANGEIRKAGLAPIPDIGTDDGDDFIDIDTIALARELENMDVDDEGYSTWEEETYERIIEELESLNQTIEQYLAKIDAKYGTQYAPTGAQRIF